MAPPRSPELTDLLQKLERLLGVERSALLGLERDKLDALTDEKLKLSQVVQNASASASPTTQDVERLKRIRTLAAENHLLLAHARSCMQGVMDLFTGTQHASPQHSPGGSVKSAAPARPVAVNIRG